jgi:signal peptidase I
MSGAGRGVTPGAGSEAGQGGSAASPGPGQDRTASANPSADPSTDDPSADHGAGPPGPGQADSGAKAEPSGRAEDGAGPEGPPADGKPGQPRQPAGRRGRRKRSFWREFPVLVVIALLLAVVIKTYAIQAFFIPSGSMENTLEINDRVLVNKLVYDVRGIHRGDIVVFNGDGSWDPGTPPRNTNFLVKFGQGFASMFGFGHPGDILIKRVIGLPGDKVACCDAQGRVTVNGVPLNEQSYLYPGDSPSEVRFNIVVPAGRLWVMGDHRLISDDSRNHLGEPGGGTVPENAVVGRAFVIIWPPSRWRFLPIPETFQQPKLNAAAPPADTAALPASGGTAALLSARLEPSSPALPLTLGFAVAVPLTWLQRRTRLRYARRRMARPATLARRMARRATSARRRAARRASANRPPSA